MSDNPYRTLADDLAAVSEEERMLLSVQFRGVTSDTQKPCGCFYGTVIPESVRAAMPSFYVTNTFHTNARFRAWVRSKGFEVHLGDRFVETDAPLVRILYDIQCENDSTITGINTEESARKRYDHMLGYLRRAADAWDRGRGRAS